MPVEERWLLVKKASRIVYLPLPGIYGAPGNMRRQITRAVREGFSNGNVVYLPLPGAVDTRCQVWGGSAPRQAGVF